MRRDIRAEIEMISTATHSHEMPIHEHEAITVAEIDPPAEAEAVADIAEAAIEAVAEVAEAALEVAEVAIEEAAAETVDDTEGEESPTIEGEPPSAEPVSGSRENGTHGGDITPKRAHVLHRPVFGRRE
jgi:hypothetical protein